MYNDLITGYRALNALMARTLPAKYQLRKASAQLFQCNDGQRRNSVLNKDLKQCSSQ